LQAEQSSCGSPINNPRENREVAHWFFSYHHKKRSRRTCLVSLSCHRDKNPFRGFENHPTTPPFTFSRCKRAPNFVAHWTRPSTILRSPRHSPLPGVRRFTLCTLRGAPVRAVAPSSPLPPFPRRSSRERAQCHLSRRATLTWG